VSEPLYDVEGGTGPAEAPAPEPVQASPEPEAPEPAQPEPQAEPEGVDVGGQRMVPLAALARAREENRSLRDKAQQFDQIAGEWQNARPYVEFLKNNPQLLAPREQPQAQAPVAPEQDEELVSLARTLDLYTPDGKPDVGRAKVVQDRMEGRARKIAQEAVQPLQEQSVQAQAHKHFQDALAVNMNGVKPNPDVLRQIWKTTDPKVLATEQGAAAAVLMAMGFGAMNAQPQASAPQAPAQAPVYTEPSGGRNVGRPSISEFEQRVLKTRGMDAAKYQEHTRGFRPGEVNVLEND
jgi:hypothetical protein